MVVRQPVFVARCKVDKDAANCDDGDIVNMLFIKDTLIKCTFDVGDDFTNKHKLL